MATHRLYWMESSLMRSSPFLEAFSMAFMREDCSAAADSSSEVKMVVAMEYS